jgi:predicted DNA-binding protein (UPF0251 family)
MQRTNHNSINYVHETLRALLRPSRAKVARYLPERKMFQIQAAEIQRFSGQLNKIVALRYAQICL